MLPVYRSHMKYSSYIRKLAWAYVFLLVNVNLQFNNGSVINFTPAWIGLLIIYMLWDSLKIKGRREITVLALVLSAVVWLLAFLGRGSLLAGVICGVLILWINHMVFGSLSEEAIDLGYEEYGQKFKKIRDAILVFYLLGAACELFGYLVIITIICAIVLLITAVYVCIILFRYSRDLEKKGD